MKCFNIQKQDEESQFYDPDYKPVINTIQKPIPIRAITPNINTSLILPSPPQILNNLEKKTNTIQKPIPIRHNPANDNTSLTFDFSKRIDDLEEGQKKTQEIQENSKKRKNEEEVPSSNKKKKLNITGEGETTEEEDDEDNDTFSVIDANNKNNFWNILDLDEEKN